MRMANNSPLKVRGSSSEFVQFGLLLCSGHSGPEPEPGPNLPPFLEHLPT